jgi:hypothetical protein
VKFVSPKPNALDGGPPLVGCSRLYIQYIRNYPQYVAAISICNEKRLVVMSHKNNYTQLKHYFVKGNRLKKRKLIIL